MGLFDSLFGNLFDFNGDGKTTLDEEFLAFNIFEEATKDDDFDDFDDFDEEEDW